MSFSVGQRTREIGVRMAVGAQPANVLTMVIRQGAIQVIVGLVIGVGLAGLIGRGLGFLISNVSPWDPVVIAGVLVTLSLTGLVATMIPARRAAGVDPMQALRYE
jgi:ABC-type antimicrobial peptide transport system permease subunit